MRGNTRRGSGGASTTCAPRGLAGDRHPRAPRPRGALPLVGLPAPRVRPLRIRALGALLPETPARKGDCPPYRPIPVCGAGHDQRHRKSASATGILTIRLSAEERAAIDEAAERAGLVVGSYARPGPPWRARSATGAAATRGATGACTPFGRAGPYRRQPQPTRQGREYGRSRLWQRDRSGARRSDRSEGCNPCGVGA